jgi:hypothetical protein
VRSEGSEIASGKKAVCHTSGAEMYDQDPPQKDHPRTIYTLSPTTDGSWTAQRRQGSGEFAGVMNQMILLIWEGFTIPFIIPIDEEAFRRIRIL